MITEPTPNERNVTPDMNATADMDLTGIMQIKTPTPQEPIVLAAEKANTDKTKRQTSFRCYRHIPTPNASLRIVAQVKISKRTELATFQA